MVSTGILMVTAFLSLRAGGLFMSGIGPFSRSFATLQAILLAPEWRGKQAPFRKRRRRPWPGATPERPEGFWHAKWPPKRGRSRPRNGFCRVTLTGLRVMEFTTSPKLKTHSGWNRERNHRQNVLFNGWFRPLPAGASARSAQKG